MNTNEFVVRIISAICCFDYFIFKVNAFQDVNQNQSYLNGDVENSKVSEHSHDEENRVRYIAAVLEYEPYNKWSEDGKGYNILRNNSKTIVKYAEKAKSYDADIIVGPEYAIPSFSMFDFGNDTDSFLTFSQYVPDPSLRIVACHQEEGPTNKYEAIKILSCGALNNAIYIVVGLFEVLPCSEETIDQALPWGYEFLEDCPKEGYILYNTLVAFDRKGAVVARYRKQHLFYEESITPGPQDDTEAILITDFNVALSLQVCWDIAYEQPGYANVKNYGIRDVVTSKAWFDTLPFFLANGVENGFSRGLAVNLLASGYHRPEEGNVGSGIFKGFSPQELPLYTADENSGNVLVISSIETIPASSLTLPINVQNDERSPLNNTEESDSHDIDIIIPLEESHDSDIRHRKLHYDPDLGLYTRVLMNFDDSEDVTNNTVCHQSDFCCTFEYKYSGNQTYYMFVFSGILDVGGGSSTLEINTCAVVWCQNTDYKTCGNIDTEPHVEDEFSYLHISTDSLSFSAIYPVYNHRNTKLIDNDVFDVKLQGSHSSISSVRSVENLLVVSLSGMRFGQEN